MKRRWFITLPTFVDPEDALDWCEANGIKEPRLHRGDDGRIRGRGEQVRSEANEEGQQG